MAWQVAGDDIEENTAADTLAQDHRGGVELTRLLELFVALRLHKRASAARQHAECPAFSKVVVQVGYRSDF